ncbi:hypothetical protein ABZ419_27295 [Streptomyces cinnamoneus]|uniref:hypothetical protein n=1 Tax=Streptomyces cinnamoneus TaxID=53446 RepID=UPI003408AC35
MDFDDLNEAMARRTAQLYQTFGHAAVPLPQDQTCPGGLWRLYSDPSRTTDVTDAALRAVRRAEYIAGPAGY